MYSPPSRESLSPLRVRKLEAWSGGSGEDDKKKVTTPPPLPPRDKTYSPSVFVLRLIYSSVASVQGERSIFKEIRLGVLETKAGDEAQRIHTSVV